MKTGVVFCCLLVGIVLCIGTASGKVINLSEYEKSSILYIHNEYRSDVYPWAANMIRLKWSEVLANIAQKHVEKCKTYHSNEAERNKAAAPYFSSVGENIISYTGRKFSYYPDLVDNWWGEEKKIFRYPSCDSGKNCRHYTQIIWSSTTHVGCAVADCPHNGKTLRIFVCNYGPAGNTPGVNPYIEGFACSQCPAGFNNIKFCYNMLCASDSAAEQAALSSTVDTSSSLIQLILNMKETEREEE